MTDKYKYRGQIRGRVCGGPEGGVRQIHVCQWGHLRRPVEGGTETWTGDVHLEGEERKVGHTHSNNDLLLMTILSIIFFYQLYTFFVNLFSLSRGLPSIHESISCQLKLKGSLPARSHTTQYKHSCLGHCTERR